MAPQHAEPLTPGTLYLVPTPIGNLEDITLRSIRVLKQCDAVAAEDTRRTGMLLKHLEISKPLISCYQFNEARRSEEIVGRLKRGDTIALVTDGGMPAISDPGERVVRAVREAGLRVEALPGACALIVALAASGLPGETFHFFGFLPHKKGKRRNRLEEMASLPGALILYESPYRIDKLLHELAEILPDREVVLARELTKQFEEYLRGTPAGLIEQVGTRRFKGEFVVLISGAAKPSKKKV